MHERESVEERLLGMVRDGIDAAVLLARSSLADAVQAGDEKLKELAAAVEAAAQDLDEAMITLLDAEADEDDEAQG